MSKFVPISLADLMKFVPTISLADLIPEEENKCDYIWKKEQREHTLEIVGYDGDVEMGTAIILDNDGSLEALKRVEEILWVEDRVNVMYSDGITLGRLREAVIQQYEIYG